VNRYAVVTACVCRVTPGIEQPRRTPTVSMGVWVRPRGVRDQVKNFHRLQARVIIIALSVALSVSAATPAAADPPFVGWSATIPALTYQYEPTSLDDCVSGKPSCVARTIRQMQNRVTPLSQSCSHRAVFALAYLRTTEQYLNFSQKPGFLRDPAFVNHQDVAFAQMYFDAYDDFAAGRISRVPPAWRVAFRVADGKQVNGMGDLLLGMNAHVNRDLPFVLAAIGLTMPDGSSRKLDHDQINIMLNHVVEPLINELGARFDPSIAVAPTPFGLGFTGLMQTLLVWRELAWRNAELLVAAPTEAARDVIAAQIEASAEATGTALMAASRYLPPLQTTVSRDSYCVAQQSR